MTIGYQVVLVSWIQEGSDPYDGSPHWLLPHWLLPKVWFLFFTTGNFSSKAAKSPSFSKSISKNSFVLSWIQLGTIAAFFVVRLADRFGRKPVLVLSLAGYGVLTFATFFAQDLALYAALQSGARMLMVTQLAVAYIMLSEEVPGDLRGRANALLGASASVGAVLPALFLAPLEDSSIGWRGLFLLGSLPILMVPIFMTKVRETQAYQARRHEP